MYRGRLCIIGCVYRAFRFDFSNRLDHSCPCTSFFCVVVSNSFVHAVYVTSYAPSTFSPMQLSTCYIVPRVIVLNHSVDANVTPERSLSDCVTNCANPMRKGVAGPRKLKSTCHRLDHRRLDNLRSSHRTMTTRRPVTSLEPRIVSESDGTFTVVISVGNSRPTCRRDSATEVASSGGETGRSRTRRIYRYEQHPLSGCTHGLPTFVAGRFSLLATQRVVIGRAPRPRARNSRRRRVLLSPPRLHFPRSIPLFARSLSDARYAPCARARAPFPTKRARLVNRNTFSESIPVARMFSP